MLEVAGVAPDDALLAAWRARVGRVLAQLGWPATGIVVRRHAAGAALALAAPCDQLFLATEVNEWALCAALQERDPARWCGLQEALAAAALAQAPDPATFLPPVLDESGAMARFLRLAEREARPALRSLLEAASARGLPHVLDETELTLGAGAGGRSFPLAALPVVSKTLISVKTQTIKSETTMAPPAETSCSSKAPSPQMNVVR